MTWYYIWLLLGELEVSSDADWSTYANAIRPDVEATLLSFTNNIILVDSNEDRARYRFWMRNEGNDRLRSNKINYIKVQNYFYATLALNHPDKICMIDINWFDGNLTLVQDVICEIIATYNGTNFPQGLQFEPLILNDVDKLTFTEEFEANERTRPPQTIMFTDELKKFNFCDHINTESTFA
jgi:hypothetical protein